MSNVSYLQLQSAYNCSGSPGSMQWICLYGHQSHILITDLFNITNYNMPTALIKSKFDFLPVLVARKHRNPAPSGKKRERWQVGASWKKIELYSCGERWSVGAAIQK